MGWDSIYDIMSLTDEMKERFEKWKKYSPQLISSTENNERVEIKGKKDSFTQEVNGKNRRKT